MFWKMEAFLVYVLVLFRARYTLNSIILPTTAFAALSIPEAFRLRLHLQLPMQTNRLRLLKLASPASSRNQTPLPPQPGPRGSPPPSRSRDPLVSAILVKKEVSSQNLQGTYQGGSIMPFGSRATTSVLIALCAC